MMNFHQTGIAFSGGIGFHLHMVFGVMAIVGLILFIYWSVKHLNKKQLARLTALLLVIGIIGMLLTATFGWRNWQGMMNNFDDDIFEEMLEEMEEMEEHMKL